MDLRSVTCQSKYSTNEFEMGQFKVDPHLQIKILVYKGLLGRVGESVWGS